MFYIYNKICKFWYIKICYLLPFKDMVFCWKRGKYMLLWHSELQTTYSGHEDTTSFTFATGLIFHCKRKVGYDRDIEQLIFYLPLSS